MADASSKSETFHRLAAQRVDAIQDKLRIFSNLSGPHCEWTPAEVMTYFGQIHAAVDEALTRFKETRRWKMASSTDATITASIPTSSGPDGTDAETMSSSPTFTEPSSSSSDTTDATTDRYERRKRTIVDVLREADNDRDALAEMVALQREVIERMQERIDGLEDQRAM